MSSSTSKRLAMSLTMSPTSSENAMEIFRMKGLLAVYGENRKYYLQAVQQIFDITVGEPWPALSKASPSSAQATSRVVADSPTATDPTQKVSRSPTDPDARRRTKLVIIGRNLNLTWVQASFQQCSRNTEA
eukprot:gb/GEZN01021266.1/.p1 GENE.gb/GEZN01021266.1/~~gb/GEZN01021266.1/.p1  ORF type:complete len:131 (+),score=22.78 gb/GEZN01021266.1/:148-540(+)